MELSPVFSAAVDNNGETVGYIKLTNFSSKAAEDTEKAIKDLEVRILTKSYVPQFFLRFSVCEIMGIGMSMLLDVSSPLCLCLFKYVVGGRMLSIDPTLPS